MSCEQEADERDRLAYVREKDLDELVSDLAMLVADRHRRAQDAIERSRARVAAARERLDRSEAALVRSEASATWALAQIERAASDAVRQRARQAPGAHGNTEHVQVLRKHLSVTAAELVTALDELAHVHEVLADRDPPQASEHRGAAEAARNAAHEVREIGRRFSD